MAEEIPDKLYCSVREVAEVAGVPQHVLRFWEKRFPRLSPKRSRGGHRRYTKKDIDLILQIKELVREQGFTTRGAREQLRQAGSQVSPQRQDLHWLRQELAEIIALLKLT